MCREHTDESKRLMDEYRRHLCAACMKLGRPCNKAESLLRAAKTAMTNKDGCR